MKGTFKGHLEYREVESLTREVDDAKSPLRMLRGHGPDRSHVTAAGCMFGGIEASHGLLRRRRFERSDRFGTCQRSTSILKST